MKIIKKILAFFNILVICGCFLSVINANAEESASVLISSANGVRKHLEIMLESFCQ